MITNYSLLLYPSILLFITFYGCRVYKKDYNEPFISLEQTKLLQGIFCVCVILHHLTQSITGYGSINKGPITIFSSMGILFTAIFFFLSGYGLIYSVLNKENYLYTFLKHRLPVILVPFFISNIIYLLVRIFYLRIPTNEINILKCLTGYVLLNGNGWYIIEIFYLYIAFFIIFMLVKNKDLAIVFLSVFTIFIIIIGYYSGHDYTDIGNHWFKGEWWYNSTFTFIIGLIFARFKNVIFTFFKKHYFVILSIVSVLFIITFIIEEKILNEYGYYRESFTIDKISSKLITLFAQSILCIIFTLLVILINMKIKIGNRCLSFLSIISTELFLIHNVFLKSIFNFTYTNAFIEYAIVLLCSIISAAIMHNICIPIINFIQNIGRKKKYLKDCENDLFRQRREANSKKAKSILLAIIVSIFIITGLLAVYNNTIKLPLEYKKELSVLRNSNVGDEIKFGNFETDYYLPGYEHLSWIVLDKKDHNLLLVTKEGISSSAYLQKHQETNWHNSDLYYFLNETLYNQIFSSYEKACIIPNPQTGDLLSLLSEDEALKYFNDNRSRQIKVTKASLKNGVNINSKSKVNEWDIKGYNSSWWWLRGNDTLSITAPIVSVDGEIITDEKYVNRPNGAIRPIVWLHIEE